ncbi:MAG TPA: amidohydrolase [Negativicutes bacterium]|nr:amidohydrolase [Negativicutes bacterium]
MDKIEEKIIALIDNNRETIISFGRDIYSHAELGYKEFRTAAKFAEALRSLNLRTEEGLAVTGVKGYLKGNRQNTVVALIGELDALKIPSHPFANPETGAAHCCGHHAQLTGVIGAALALSDPEISAALGGEVVFFAVPAEEYGEIEFKNQLTAEGKIRYGGGKCELIRIGAFDEVDLAIVNHSDEAGISIGNGSSNGFVSKVVRYIGRAAHAAAAPEKGVNALNAASLGLTALAYQRETFRDQDSVRVHPIITKGGSLVNVVPNEVVIETLVRASNIEAILDAEKKTDRAFLAGAQAIGADIEIATMPGYLPRIPQIANPVLFEAIKEAVPEANVQLVDPTSRKTGSTDVGDLDHVLPVLGFYTGGVSGGLHTDQFRITDEDAAYISTAKIFALSAYKLLKDNAVKAREITKEFQPRYTKEQYVEFMDSLMRVEKKAYKEE